MEPEAREGVVPSERDFSVYSLGVCAASVCTTLSPDEATERLNREHPTGIASRWAIAPRAFASGEDNGRACECAPTTHRHYLFEC